MNPALLIIVVLSMILLWFLLAFLYRPVGKLFYRIYKDAMDEITKEDEKENEEWKDLLEQ